MKANASLHTLVDLSQNNVDDAARHLQELRTQREAAQSQLEMLQTYRQDYAQRLLDVLVQHHRLRLVAGEDAERLHVEDEILGRALGPELRDPVEQVHGARCREEPDRRARTPGRCARPRCTAPVPARRTSASVIAANGTCSMASTSIRPGPTR